MAEVALERYLREIRKIQSGEMAPVYFLQGEEFFLADYFIKTLEKQLQETNPTLKRKLFLGVEDTERQFLNELFSYSLFETSRLVVYKEVRYLSSKSRSQLLQYIKNPASGITLVLIQSEDVRSNEFYKTLKKESLFLDISTPDKEGLFRLGRAYVNNRGYKIEDRALEKLVDLCGFSLSRIYNQLDKLLLYVDQRSNITLEDVDQMVEFSTTFTIDRLLEAIGKRNLKQTFVVGLALLKQNVSLQHILVSLTYFFQHLWYYGSGQLRQSRLNYYEKMQLARFREYSRVYNRRELRRVFVALEEADLEGKTSSKKAEDILLPLLYRVVKG